MPMLHSGSLAAALCARINWCNSEKVADGMWNYHVQTGYY